MADEENCLSRREFIKLSAAGAALAMLSTDSLIAMAADQAPASIPVMTAKDIPAGNTLYAALKARKSYRAWQDKPVSMEQLSAILWAANGVNRDDGKRTAPTPVSRNYVEIYLTLPQGTYHYEPQNARLALVTPDNLMAKVGTQADVAKSQAVITFTARMDVFKDMPAQREVWAHCTAGCMAQNVYLAAASMGLGTRVAAFVNKAEVIKNLKLPETEVPLYIMPIGVPA